MRQAVRALLASAAFSGGAWSQTVDVPEPASQADAVSDKPDSVKPEVEVDPAAVEAKLEEARAEGWLDPAETSAENPSIEK